MIRPVYIKIAVICFVPSGLGGCVAISGEHIHVQSAGIAVVNQTQITIVSGEWIGEFVVQVLAGAAVLGLAAVGRALIRKESSTIARMAA